MYSSILLLYIIVSKIDAILLAIVGILAFFIIVSWIRYIVLCDNNEITKQDRADAQLPISKDDPEDIGVIRVRKYYALIKKLIICLIVVLILFVIMPKTEHVIGYIALKEVDKYAEENPKSIANPKVIFKTADDIAGLAGKIFNLVDKSVDAANNGLDIANKNLKVIKNKK
jgi:hypothetical protein